MRPLADEAASPGLEDTQAAPGSSPDRTLTSAGRMPAPAIGEGLPNGLRLGHFQIDKKLGAGGMGEVYLATDLALDRLVAIKVLPAGATSGTARERLIREARAQARVNHPNVAHIYFIGEEDGRLYFAMEHVVGTTLAARIASGPLPAEEALAVIRGATLGLREAQRSGFLHRDVKPSNLMVDAHGVVKVVDFGLAAGDPQTAVDGPVEQTTMAGTPLYMAPEQARGEPIDLRADIYALGATLFHLVSGEPPFHADSAEALVTLHATAARPPVPRGANPRTAIAAIDSLIARMMAPLPADRFASYDELLHAIELVSTEHTRPAGFWARLMAAGIDVGIIGFLVTLIEGAIPGPEISIGPAVFPLLALYQTFALRRWGTTIGKALFELEVVTTDTGTWPSTITALRRSLLLCALPILGSALSIVWALFELGANDLGGLVAGASIVLLAGLLLHASLRTPGKRAPWDRFAGTVVRYRKRQPTTRAARG